MTGVPVTGGTVVEFDAAGGMGVVASHKGRRYQFHCTQLADGSRSVEAGAEVTFAVVAGRLGRWEASAISKK